MGDQNLSFKNLPIYLFNILIIKVQQELQSVQDENTDLKEKLETIRLKRAKDLEKLKEFEKMRIQHEQLVEFKSRIMESQAALQKDVQKAKHEAREAIEAKEQHAEEMADLSETVEMATLDKEMAEEKAESLQLELDVAKDKIEELTLDLDIIKAEVGDGGGSDGAITHFEVKQLTAKNEKMHETLIKMRDLSAQEKSEIIRLTKDLEAKTGENTEVINRVERLQRENDELESTIGDLQEQVDAALGAEEMVENLTTKCLDLEDKLTAVTEEKLDLETLHEMDEELQENLREAELELREDLDLAHGKVREAGRARDAAYEIIHDHETTITKFRDLVNKVQEQNIELRANIEKEARSVSGVTSRSGDVPALSHASEIIDFKKMFAESKAHSRAIDMELRNCDVAQANRHINILSSYMTASFTARGGDNEAVLVLLLVPRMIWKANILLSQLKEKFIMAADVPPIDKESLLKNNHAIDRYAFGGLMIHQLNQMASVLYNYHYALSTCSPATFLRVGTLYPEMSAHEKAGLDFFIELLRKDQLDENVPTEAVEKCIHYFQQVYPMHLAEDVRMDHTNVLANHLKSLQSACDCLDTGLSVGKALLPTGSSDANSEISVLYKTTEAEVNQLKQVVKNMKRRLPQQEEQYAANGGSLVSGGDSATSNCTALLITEPSVCYSASEAQRTERTVKDLSKLTKAFGSFCKIGTQQASLLSDSESGIPLQKLTNLLRNSVDNVFLDDTSIGVGDENPLNGFDTIRSIMSKAIKIMGDQNRALQDGDWDIADVLKEKEARSTTVNPVTVRAETYKQEIKEAESMKYRLESKEDGLKEMKRSFKEKAEELSEMQVRKDKAEKRLADATRDAEMVREKLHRKLDDTQALLKRKEKEFEETMDQLQTDIDSLENERGELKNKLKETTKKVLLEGISRGSSSIGSSGTGGSPSSLLGAGIGGPVSLGPSVPAPVRDSPMLLKQNRCLQMAILSAKEECYRRQGEDLKRRLTKMKPLIVPRKLVRGVDIGTSTVSPESPASEKRDISKEETPSLDELIRKVGNLRQKIDTALVSASVIDLSNKHNKRADGVDLMATAGSARKDLILKSLRDKQIKDEFEQLRLEVARLIASRKPGGQVEADFCKFPTPQLSRALNEDLKDYKVVGRIRVDGNISDQVKIKTVPIIVGPKDLRQIHQKILS